MDGTRCAVRHAPPHLGQHTDDVLRDVLGIDAGHLDALRTRNVIR
jgi:crotonobetainyl-CoA:carnitine CoA-transferase CaiB-like acyl-CoA transferase